MPGAAPHLPEERTRDALWGSSPAPGTERSRSAGLRADKSRGLADGGGFARGQRVPGRLHRGEGTAAAPVRAFPLPPHPRRTAEEILQCNAFEGVKAFIDSRVALAAYWNFPALL